MPWNRPVTGRIVRLLVCLVLLLCPPARADQPSREVFLENLTWTEVRDALAAGTTTIIVPIGGTEQNGPDMALGKHNARAKNLSARIARALGNALVAPVIAYVPEGGLHPPTAHMRFPGTITIPEAAFRQTLDYAARSFALHGFRDIVFLGDHGGYQADDAAVAEALDREWAKTPVRVHAVAAYYGAATGEFASALREKGFSQAEIGTHAGLADTSLTLAVDPDLVRLDRLRGGPRPTAADGVYGDPRRASAELGQMGAGLIVARTVAAIRAATARPKQ